MIINCIAVDDEPLALDIIEEYTNKIPYLKLKKRCKSAFEAMEVLRSARIDLIFLDIQMPELSGLDFLKTRRSFPNIIFTTAYEKYAVESYDYEAVDYLLKPFSFERFLTAVNKAVDTIQPKPVHSNAISQKSDKFLFVTTSAGISKIVLDEIIYIKGLKDYVEIKTVHGNYISRQNLKTLHEQLSSDNFIRVHRSFIVPLNRIDTVVGNTVIFGKESIPVGKIYKPVLLSAINKQRLGI